MTTAILNTGTQALQQHSLSLAQELAQRGIPIIDNSIVKKHMRKTVTESRRGIYRLIGPLLYGFMSILNFTISSSHSMHTWSLIMLMCVVSGLASWFGLLYANVAFFFALGLIAGFIVCFFGMLALHAKLGHTASFARATMIWIRTEMDANRASLLAFSVPERLHDRAARTTQIDGVKLNRLHFGPDPLLEVVRIRGLRVERAFIGGWETGVPAIDNA
jgi:hypothetical protein